MSVAHIPEYNKFICFGKDITKRKKAEEALKISEAQKRTLLENASDGIYFRKNGVYEYVNHRFAEITGYSESELTDPDFDIDVLLFDEDRAFMHDRMNKRRMGIKIPPKFQIGLKRKDGKRVEIEAYIRFEDKDGDLISTGFIRDITEQKNAERELKESETKYRNLVQQSNDAIFLLDTNGYHLEANAKAIEMLGYSLDELRQMSYKDTIDNSKHEDSRNKIEGLLKGKKYSRYEKYFISKTGDKIPAEISVSPIKDANGKVVYILSIVRDISGRKKTEKELIEAKERAEESDRLKSAFLANTSHEIRTPMNGILGFIQLLKDPKLEGDEIQEYISIIEKSGKRMLNILNDIIDISKIESGQTEVHETDFNLNKQIKYFYEFFLPEALNKDIDLSVNIPLKDEKAEIHTDKEKFNIILSNIIKNALKFTEKGKIKLGYELKNGNLNIYVQDTGIGIHHKQKDIIFDRFVQAEHSTDRMYEGAGLGLAIAKAYVDMLGGKIWFDSLPDVGSTFYFSLPQKTLKFIDKEDTMDPQKENEKSQVKILIVEDDHVSNLLLNKMLKRKYKHVASTYNAAEAIRILKESPDYDVVLMDIKMPEMDGYEATRKIREFNRDIIIIAESAYAFADDEKKALEAGCDGYISKPIDEDKLYRLIEKHVFGKQKI